MTLGDGVLVAVAGFLAGAVNAVAGGGTLISFPALLATGMEAVAANITSSVGLLTGYAGGSVGYRRELSGQGRRFKQLGIVSAVGGVAGAVILLLTPAGTFEVVVPYLILVSCALLAAQPRLAEAVRRRRGDEQRDGQQIGWGAQGGVLVSAVYGSYFGAGLGVLLLAVLGALVDDGLQRLNGLKTLLSLLINIVGVIVFLASGRVAWASAGILAVTAFFGGTVGAELARRLSPKLLRGAVIVLGVVVAGAMIVQG